MCLFCDFANHEKQALFISETERTVSFLDINPANEGHVLIIHFHVFPRLENDGFDWIYPKGENEVSEKVAEKIKAAL